MSEEEEGEDVEEESAEDDGVDDDDLRRGGGRQRGGVRRTRPEIRIERMRRSLGGNAWCWFWYGVMWALVPFVHPGCRVNGLY